MMTDDLKSILADHALWLRGEGGRRANLAGAYLARADLAGAYLARANLAGAYLARADLADAYLARANLAGAYLAGAYLVSANLVSANLVSANLAGLTGNMREIRSMHIDTWPIAYTADTLQIGCQRHPIAEWRKWTTDEGREWIARMDREALGWADRNLALVLQIIDAHPATPTGNEASPSGAGQEGDDNG